MTGCGKVETLKMLEYTAFREIFYIIYVLLILFHFKLLLMLMKRTLRFKPHEPFHKVINA